jgi:hypothetical protein
MEFGWFLLENGNRQILINGIRLVVEDFIKNSKEYSHEFFSQHINNLDGNFSAKIVLWKDKPLEYCKFYFLNESETEILKQNTGLNKKSDDFWHSVYIKSSLFKSVDDVLEDDNLINSSNKKVNRDKKNS